MNVCILGNAHAVQRWNDQKVVKCMCQNRAGVGKAGNYCKIMCTIPKTSYSQISFRVIVVGVGSDYLGCGKCGLRCNIMKGER
jgi:hypothetical protein